MPDSGQATAAANPLADLPIIDRSEVALRRGLFRRRGPLRLSVAGRALVISILGEAQRSAAASNISFALSVGSDRAWLSMPRALLSDLLMAAEPKLRPDVIDGDLLGMVLELLFAKELRSLEASLGRDVQVIAEERVGEGTLALHLQCACGGVMHEVRLSFDRALGHDLGALLDRLPLERRQLPDLRLTVQLCLGSAVLPLAKVDALAPGDVVVPHTPPLAQGKAIVLVGERWSAPGEIADRSLTLSAPLQPMTEDLMDGDKLNDAAERTELEDGTFDEYPVKLVFEVGRSEMNLGDLRALGVGHVFALGRDPEQSVDIIAGGRRIAWGQLVRIGESLGVRILRLSQDG